MEESKENRGCIICEKIWTIIRKMISAAIMLGSLALIFYAIAKGYAALPGPIAMHYAVFVFVLILLGYLEGLQIAILEMEKSRLPTDDAFRKRFKRGISTWKLATGNKGNNVRRFLIGRQFFVVFVVFLCAQLTTYPTLPKDGWPEWLFVLIIDTGLPGALVVLAFGQLMPQLIAATHPMRFMNLWFSWSVVGLTLVLEFVGIAHFAWVLSWFIKLILGWGKQETIQCDLNVPTTKSCSEIATICEEDDDADDELTVTCEEAIDVAMFHAAITGTEEVSADIPEEKKKSINSPWLAYRSKDEETLYQDWGYNPVSGAPFPGPKQVVEHLVAQNKQVPRYLLPTTHIKHIPPHVVAYDLLKKEAKLEKKCLEIERLIRELQGISPDHTTLSINSHTNTAMENDF